MTISVPGHLIPLTAKTGGGYESVEEGTGSGTLTNGETFTIAGSNFEAIANPLPSAFDDGTEYTGFSNGDVVPSGSASQSRWGGTPASHEPAYFSTTYKLPGRPWGFVTNDVKAALHDLKTNPSGPSRSITGIYLSGWMYMTVSPYASTHSTTSSTSFKYNRIWSGFDAAAGYRHAVLFRNDTPSGGMQFTENSSVDPYDGQPFGAGEYIRSEIEIINAVYNSSNDNYDAIARVYVKGKLISWARSSAGFSGTDIPITLDKRAGSFETLRCAMWGSDPNFPDRVDENFRLYMMEIHEQPNRARVELSNSPTFDVTVEQERYYQKTISRTNTQIQFEVFLGDLDTGSPIYCHIVKTDGSVIDFGQVN